MTHKNKTLWIPMFFAFTMIVPGFAKDSIEVNKSREFAGNDTYEQILDVDLTTERTTRVQIIVKKQDEIFQNHRLTLGPNGVVDGEHRGAVQWGCELPPESDASDLQVFILVEDFAGKGSPVSYDIKSKKYELFSEISLNLSNSSESDDGFHKSGKSGNR